MEEPIRIVKRSHRQITADLSLFGRGSALIARRFHSSFPMYRPTPLVDLADTADVLGLASLYVKDESQRFGLNAFKALGGSYAIGRYLAGKLGMDIEDVDFAMLTSDACKNQLGEITFVTATDGNHGRGVAWTAHQLGQKSVVYMPKGSAPERLANIKALGADASITDLNYDDTVRMARRMAEQNGWVLVQDTAWDGYTQIPAWIMQGYGTMALEAYEQLPAKPTHIFLQAGVGSMAGSVAAFFASVYGDERPVIAIVEPHKADCHYRTALADDGKLHFVTGSMDTIMAGLACGEPSPLSWGILADYADFFLSIPDRAAAKGMRILGNPAGRDTRIISGESGASTFGCVAGIMTDPALAGIKEQLGLDRHSRILVFSTEGDTDKKNYRAIVWDGV